MSEIRQNPPWLTALVDQRLALMKEHTGAHLDMLKGFDLVLTPLTEPGPDANAIQRRLWERTCDACGRYCPPHVDFYTGVTVGMLTKDVKVTFSYGVCADCRP